MATPGRRFWLPSRGFLAFVVILIVVVAISVPGYFSSRRASRERHASSTLKALSTAEADFRVNDLDRNGVQDYWTGDVAGLHPLKLIDVETARADARPLLPIDGAKPSLGFNFIAMDQDESVTPTESYRNDTDKSGRKVHNLDRFGFCAYPQGGWDGKYCFIVNESNTIWRFEGLTPKLSFPKVELRYYGLKGQ